MPLAVFKANTDINIKQIGRKHKETNLAHDSANFVALNPILVPSFFSGMQRCSWAMCDQQAMFISFDPFRALYW